VVADSQQAGYEATKAIDGSSTSMWHTQWSPTSPAPPHTLTVNMGKPQSVSGFKYLPRVDGNSNGMIGNWRFWTSTDGISWSLSTQGTFVKSAAEKTVLLP
jgi:hypothetical protein